MTSVAYAIARLDIGRLCKIQSYSSWSKTKSLGKALGKDSIYNAIFLGRMKHMQNTCVFYMFSNKGFKDEIVYTKDNHIITCILL